MDTNTSLALRSGVQDHALDEEVPLVGHESSLFRSLRGVRSPLDLVDQYFVLINDWAEDEVSGFALDDFVAKASHLVEAEGTADPEHALPRVRLRQSAIQLVRELQSLGVIVELGVEKEVAL